MFTVSEVVSVPGSCSARVTRGHMLNGCVFNLAEVLEFRLTLLNPRILMVLGYTIRRLSKGGPLLQRVVEGRLP